MLVPIKRNLYSIGYLALNTFRETVRDRILYLLIGFSLLVIAASLLAASISLGQDVRVIESFGLTALLVFLLVIVVFIGTQLVYREKEHKTIYFILTKPISREVFYLGKFVGLALTTLVAAVVMATLFVALLSLKTEVAYYPVLSAITFVILEAWLLVALSLLFSTFTSPLASAVYTFSLALIGHSSNNLWAISQKAQPAVRYVLEFVYYVFPNLEKFNLRNEVVYSLSPQPEQILTTVAYFVGYTVVLLLLGMAAIRRHEF